LLSRVNPIEILQNETEGVDLVSFDYIFADVLKRDPETIDMPKFLSLTLNHRLTPTKE